MYDAKTLERFWSKVDRSGGPDACWMWIGGMGGSKGRGVPRFVLRHGVLVYAKALALASHDGQSCTQPKGMVVVDTCGNTMCCNPRHLTRMTRAEWQARRGRQGRSIRGSKHGRAKMDEMQAAVLRDAMRSGRMSMSEAARLAGTDPASMHALKHGVTWRHLPGANHAA